MKPSTSLRAQLLRGLRAVDARTLAVSGLALLIFFAAIVLPSLLAPAAILLLGVEFAWSAYRVLRYRGERTELRLGADALARVVVVGAVCVAAAPLGGWVLVVGLVVGLLTLLEQALRLPVETALPMAANIDGVDVPVPSIGLANAFHLVNVATAVTLALSLIPGVPAIIAAVLAVASLALAAAMSFQAVRYLYRRTRFEAKLPGLMKKLAPQFAFHWHAPRGTAYQAAMWLPYLDRLGVPYFVLVRSRDNFEEVRKLTSAPVILRLRLEDLDPIVCPSLKAVFYTNTAVRNSHMIRFPHLRHIQLNHGDSDKITSVSPTFRQYDKNFVAGQAAIDRFALHNVAILPEQMVIVGRPQLEKVVPATTGIDQITAPRVLYTPTWSGFYDDSDYSSLRGGRQLVEKLLERGCTVVFRPHPYARLKSINAEACKQIIEMLTQDGLTSGRQHVFGPKAETEWSVIDCFNGCDAMITDVSSVASDFLIANKPFAMAAVSSHGDDFVASFPLAKAAYVFDVAKDGSTSGLDETLDALLGADPKAEERRSIRRYYLGDIEPQDCVAHFVSQARAALAEA